MGSQILSSIVGLSTVLTAALSMAQGNLRHYSLVDLGTFGGPASGLPSVQSVLSSNNLVVGTAETAISDPFSPLCSSPNCKVQNGFEWRRGIKFKLSGLTAGASTEAESVNPRGTVAGDSRDGTVDPASGFPVTKATIWREGNIAKLGTLGGLSSGAISINSTDQVTGWSQTAQGESHAFLWSNGIMRDLGTLGGPVSFGGDVNERGQVVGFSFVDSAINPGTGQPTQHPFLWDQGQMIDIGLGGSLGGSGVINNHGQAIGDSFTPGDTGDHAFLWSSGASHDLGTLGGSISLPTGLTEMGHVSGVSWLPNDMGLHAVLWKDNVIHDLGAVEDDGCSWAWALNSSDQVVGISVPFCDLSQARAFLWEDGIMVDLNTLIPPDATLHLVYAYAINDAGVIAGIGVPSGVSPGDVEALGHVFVLVPVQHENSDASISVTPGKSQGVAVAYSSNLKTATEEMTKHLRRLMVRPGESR
jgi:probable HAF family extracellular repeat protein